MHAFTGFDSVSAFAGKGKAKALKIFRDDVEVKENFSRLGQLPPDLFTRIEKFTCDLYSSRATEVNAACRELFVPRMARWNPFSYHRAKTLQKHTLRPNYQAGIWKRCL